jgi:TATA-box binding protein (TBP) (component of TFIID and TFIIIB)
MCSYVVARSGKAVIAGLKSSEQIGSMMQELEDTMKGMLQPIHQQIFDRKKDQP